MFKKNLYGVHYRFSICRYRYGTSEGGGGIKRSDFRIDNGQTMRYSGKLFISDMQIQLKQMDLTRPEQMSMRPNSSANLSSIEVKYFVKKRRDNQWVKEDWAYLSGNGLKYRYEYC